MARSLHACIIRQVLSWKAAGGNASLDKTIIGGNAPTNNTFHFTQISADPAKQGLRCVRDYLPFMLSLLLCSYCAVSRILFCSSGEGPGGELGRRIFPSTPSSTSSWTPTPPLAASACAADLMPSNACAVGLMPKPAFWGSQGTLSAPFGTSFLYFF